MICALGQITWYAIHVNASLEAEQRALPGQPNDVSLLSITAYKFLEGTKRRNNVASYLSLEDLWHDRSEIFIFPCDKGNLNWEDGPKTFIKSVSDLDCILNHVICIASEFKHVIIETGY
jgi:hypothetical protein